MYTLKELQQKAIEVIETANYGGTPSTLYEPIEYGMSQGGKRIRPLLCLIANDLCSGELNKAYPAAIAIEMLHNFTLLHDDIMDASPLRRGVPTVYKKYNTNKAILSGDTMFACAYKHLLECDKDLAFDLVQTLTQGSIEVCEGQAYDMDFEDMECVPMSDYMKMIGLKTAVLIACSAKMGAVIAGASPQDAERLYNYGYNLGLAFQIADDWLDTYGDPAVFGKAIGGDIVNNKKSWLMTRAFDKAGSLRKALLEAMAMPVGTPEERSAKIDTVKEIYDRLEVGEEAKQEIVRLHGLAMEYVAQLELPSEKAALLEDYAKKLIGRTK